MRGLRPLALALMLALSGCGGGTTTVTRTVRARTSTATTSSTATPSTASTPTTTSASGTPACVAADLRLSYLGQQGAAGHGLLGFTLRNTSSATCHTFGFPGVLFLNAQGGALKTIPHHATVDYFGHVPEVELTVPPGGTVSFRLGVTHGAVPGSVCTTAHGLQVIPPDDTSRLRVTIPGGAYECQDATVSPLEQGTSAYP